jgi:hypothetical protein
MLSNLLNLIIYPGKIPPTLLNPHLLALILQLEHPVRNYLMHHTQVDLFYSNNVSIQIDVDIHGKE